MNIIISPNDVLLFREAKLFNAGEAHIARSVLPVPQTLAGAIRSKILVNSDFSIDAKHLVGYQKDEPEFTILGLFFHRDEDCFATPLDIAASKGDNAYFYVKPHEIPWKNRNDKTTLFGGRRVHFESVNGFLSCTDLTAYLRNDLDENDLNNSVIDTKEFFEREERVGIKIGTANVTEEGYFYKIEFLRFEKGIKLSIWLEDKAKGAAEVEGYLGKQGFLKIGGESRFATYEANESDPLKQLQDNWRQIRGNIEEERRFKLYIATPALVKEDDRFSWNIERILTEKLKLNVVNIDPLIGKPNVISGWDYATNKPKGNKYAIPEGSVYFVEFDGNFEWDKPYVKLGELNKLGYGLALLGVWSDDRITMR